MARTGWTGQSWVIVLGGERNEFALLADKVHEVITLPPTRCSTGRDRPRAAAGNSCAA